MKNDAINSTVRHERDARASVIDVLKPWSFYKNEL